MSPSAEPDRKLRRTTLAEDAYAAVRAILLVEGRFASGAKISVEELSRELGVSRSPIWSAMARLEAEGVVEVVPRQGVFLARFDAQRVRGLFQAREGLEGMAARLAAALVTQVEMDELNALVKRQRDALARTDERDYAVATQTFHSRVAVLAGNEPIERMLAGIYARVQAMCGPVADNSWVRRAEYCDDHAALLAAFSHHDCDEAERESRRHVRRIAQSVLGE
ncbi:MAG: GntR family transcriptional regulator [Magnetospirillum sp.]|nr:GntR family transcriptional regulator [Magnetospirillum sp.]